MYRITLVLTDDQMAERLSVRHVLAHTTGNVKGYGAEILRDCGAVLEFDHVTEPVEPVVTTLLGPSTFIGTGGA